MKLILFVCTGNTCRSPMAEALFRRAWIEQGLEDRGRAASAGLAARPGQLASEKARELMSREGIDLGRHTAVKLDRELVEWASLILVMTGAHLKMITERFPAAADKTYLLKEYAGEAAENPDIEDPYGGDMNKYRRVMEEINGLIPNIILRLKKEGLAGESGPR